MHRSRSGMTSRPDSGTPLRSYSSSSPAVAIAPPAWGRERGDAVAVPGRIAPGLRAGGLAAVRPDVVQCLAIRLLAEACAFLRDEGPLAEGQAIETAIGVADLLARIAALAQLGPGAPERAGSAALPLRGRVLDDRLRGSGDPAARHARSPLPRDAAAAPRPRVPRERARGECRRRGAADTPPRWSPPRGAGARRRWRAPRREGAGGLPPS